MGWTWKTKHTLTPFIRDTILVLRRASICSQNIIHSTDSTRCWKHSVEIRIHVDTMASRDSCTFSSFFHAENLSFYHIPKVFYRFRSGFWEIKISYYFVLHYAFKRWKKTCEVLHSVIGFKWSVVQHTIVTHRPSLNIWVSDLISLEVSEQNSLFSLTRPPLPRLFLKRPYVHNVSINPWKHNMWNGKIDLSIKEVLPLTLLWCYMLIITHDTVNEFI